MDKLVAFAVAGSGKTTLLVNSLDEKRRILIITYTNTNFINLREKILHRWGYIPPNIMLIPYFSFLYTFCFRPYLHDKFEDRGINFNPPGRSYIKMSEIKHYLDQSRRIFSGKIAKAIFQFNVEENVIARINKYYDAVFVDEVQDLAGRDFDMLSLLARSNVDVLLVGDYYQHTYDTSRDGNYNANLFDDFTKYQKRLYQFGFIEHPCSLGKSYRCSPQLCEFISANLGITIESHRNDDSTIEIISTDEQTKKIIEDHSIIKLFYSEHYNYNCFSKNWGESKGDDSCQDVCVVLNKKTYNYFNTGQLSALPSSTKNKLYVALSRAHSNVYLLPDLLLN